MKIYTTKYALTAGIQIKEVAVGLSQNSGGSRYVYTKEMYSQQFVMGKTAFETRPEAVAAAEAMRDRKILSVEKQLAKLKKMSFV